MRIKSGIKLPVRRTGTDPKQEAYKLTPTLLGILRNYVYKKNTFRLINNKEFHTINNYLQAVLFHGFISIHWILQFKANNTNT